MPQRIADPRQKTPLLLLHSDFKPDLYQDNAGALQAAFGVDPSGTARLRRAAKSVLHQELLDIKVADFKSRIPRGGIHEAVIRGLLFAGLGRAAVDERGFETVRRIRQSLRDLPLPAFKTMVRDQFYMLLLDTERALAAIPSMLPDDFDTRKTAFGLITQVLGALGEYSAEDKNRLQRIAELFGVEAKLAAPANFVIAAANENRSEGKRHDQGVMI